MPWYNESLEFVLSLPMEKKTRRVSELETVYATPEGRINKEKTIRRVYS
jgi:hypothetical protein